MVNSLDPRSLALQKPATPTSGHGKCWECAAGSAGNSAERRKKANLRQDWIDLCMVFIFPTIILIVRMNFFGIHSALLMQCGGLCFLVQSRLLLGLGWYVGTSYCLGSLSCIDQGPERKWMPHNWWLLSA